MIMEQEIRPSCYRTVAEIVAALHVRIRDDKLKSVKKGGGNLFAYVSWETTAEELDRIYGEFGWSTEPLSYSGDSQSGVYLAALKLTVTAIDDATGMIVTKSAAGFGRGVAEPSGDDREKGLTVASKLQLHDTAASAAGSDAFSKAAKLLGDAFGRFLYKKEEQTPVGRTAPRGQQDTAPNLGPRPTVAELALLTAGGVAEGLIAQMPAAVWKKRLAEIQAKQQKAVAS